MVLLRTVYWKVLWGTQNGSSMASRLKSIFGTFIFKNVLERAAQTSCLECFTEELKGLGVK